MVRLSLSSSRSCRAQAAMLTRISSAAILLLFVLADQSEGQSYWCPPGSRPVARGTGTMCLCPDGTYADTAGCHDPGEARMPSNFKTCAATGAICSNRTVCSFSRDNPCLPVLSGPPGGLGNEDAAGLKAWCVLESRKINCFEKVTPPQRITIPFDGNYSAMDLIRDIKRDPANKKLYEKKFYSALDWRTDRQLGINKPPPPPLVIEAVRLLPFPPDQGMPTQPIMRARPGK